MMNPRGKQTNTDRSGQFIYNLVQRVVNRLAPLKIALILDKERHFVSSGRGRTESMNVLLIDHGQGSQWARGGKESKREQNRTVI